MSKQASDRAAGGLKPREGGDDRQRSRLEQLQRARDLAMADSADQFEEEFSKDDGAPLTDAVRAGRKAAARPAAEEDEQFAAAFEEDQAA